MFKEEDLKYSAVHKISSVSKWAYLALYIIYMYSNVE